MSSKDHSEKVLTGCSNFLQYHDPKRLHRNLNKMLIAFLIAQQDNYPDYYKDLLLDLEGLFRLLDALEGINLVSPLE